MTLPPDHTCICLMLSLLLPPAPVLLHQQMYPRTEELGRACEAVEQQILILPNRAHSLLPLDWQKSGVPLTTKGALPKLQVPAIPD